MSTRKILTTMSFAALFAGAAMAAEPTKTLESIENVESFDVASGEYVQVSGAYYRDGGLPDGALHRGPVINVGSMAVDGIFEVKATDQNANRLFDVKNVSGAGEIRFGRGVYISPESNFSNFGGTLTLFTAVNDQGNRKGSGAYFLSGTNSPSNIKAFNLEENTELSFTNGNYTLNGKIEGAGTISARTRENLNFEGDKILENAAPANVAIKGDISNFSGSYAAGESSSIKLETKLADNVVFVGWTGGTLELAGAAGDARKTITIDSHSDTTTNGNVFMYGNKAIIANNSRAGGAVDGGSGTIYFGGNNAYTQTEKLVYAFNKTTVVGNNAGHVTVGGKGAGSVMENGADITVDGVNVGYLTAGAAEGGVVNGDVNVLVKSGEVSAVYGGLGGVHTGKTTITVEGGKVGTVAIGDYYGGKVNGDMILNVNGGEIQQVYGANYIADSETSADFNGVNGNVQINVSGGTVKNIRGGINTNQPGDAATAQSKMVLNGNVEINVSGNANISIDNDKDRESILAVGGSYGSVNGNTVVNISDNATVEGIIAMGGSRNNAAVKSTFLNVSGGTLGGDIYAGALKAATVLENTNITISGGTVNGDIYGGGRADTVVKGNSNITLVGSTAKISGTIYGGGKDGGVVEGVKTLNIGTAGEAYNGTLKVRDFNAINIQNKSAATIGGDISNQVVEGRSLAKISGESDLTVDGAEFSKNQATSSSNLTGALLLSDSTSVLAVKNSTFSDNVAETTATGKPTYGGVVGFQGKGYIEASSFVGNTAKSVYQTQGAAVYVSGGSAEGVSIKNSSFVDNKAISTDGWYQTASMGGAVAAYGANVTIDGSTFSGNVVYSDADVSVGNWSLGGAVYAQSSIWGGQNPTNVKISNSVFDANRAGGSNFGAGGAIYIEDKYNGSLKMNTIISDSVFTNNVATEGGAIYVDSSDITLKVGADKNLSYVGNVATDGDSAGGFMYIVKPNAEKYPNGKGSATFDVDGSLTIGNGKVGFDSIASGSNGGTTITKLGSGILTVNSSMEYFKDSLIVSAGEMLVNNVLGASSISIANGASLGLTVGGANVLSNSSLTFENNGIFVLKARADLAAGEYDISAAGLTSFGNTKTYGGNILNGKFVVAQAQQMNLDKAGTAANVLGNGRLNLSAEGSEDVTIVMAFNSANATVNAVNTVTESLATQLAGDFKKVGAYAFDVDMSAGDTVTLSFLVGDSALSLSDFTIYRRNSGESQWTTADDISDVSYDGQYLSFVVSHFSEYGYSAVPEPATYAAIFGALALAVVAYRRRR